VWRVVLTDEVAKERLSLPAAERNALLHAVEKLEAFGPQLGFPHSSAVQGFAGLRELRPRAGRSPWRAFYQRIGDVFVIAAIGPEAQVDHRRFDKAARLQGNDWRSWRRTEVTRLSQLRTAGDIRREDLANDQVHAEYIRTALARAVAMRVLAYRTERGMSQTALARELGMQQPAVARLEAGDHEPTFSTLERLARGLGIEFHIDITPAASGLRDTA
jgi:ribosome-binding protein aMBF1 (putative translation factor)